MIIERYIEEIKEMLKRAGYAGKLITYEELQELHRKYGQGMKEKDFAMEVLEISDSNYNNVKKNGTRAKILQSKKEAKTQEEIEEIKEKLKKAGYAGKLITYEELQELYREYGQGMEEKDFAMKVLEISDSNYRNIKNNRKRAKILQSKKEVKTQEEIEEIKEKLEKAGYAGKLITYEELQELHREYGQGMEEKDFAMKVLGISYDNYMTVKNKGTRTKILQSKKEAKTQEEIEEIKEKLKKAGYAGKKIAYEELQELHREYGQGMEEKDFAMKVLEISDSNYKSVKNKGTRAKILQSKKEAKTQEEIEEIKEMLKRAGYAGKLITYEELQELHRKYGQGMEEKDFAMKVLEISDSNYRNIKNKGQRTKILQSKKEEKTQEEIEKIKEKLKKAGYAGKLITYEELQELYREYGQGMEEKDFAMKVLEIGYGNYKSVKNRGTRAIILFRNNTITLINDMMLGESRYYTKSELEEISNKNNVSIEEIINQLLCNNVRTYLEYYMNVINKGRIWLVKTKFSEEFIKENIKELKKMAKTELYLVKKRLNIDYNMEDEDLMQEAIIYIMQKRGDIEKNFKDNEKLMKQFIKGSIGKYILFKIMNNIKMRIVSLNGTYKEGINGKPKEFQDVVASSMNTEEEAMKNLKTNQEKRKETLDIPIEEVCIEEMKKQIEKGIDREIILDNVSKKLGITKETMLNLMKNYLVTKGIVRVGKNGIVLSEIGADMTH